MVARNSQPTVLIVDDNENVAGALATLVLKAGYEPAVFQSGEAARAWAQENRAAIAVVDVHLPDISGLELSQQLRQFWGEQTPIIVVSGDTSIPTLGALSQVGATYFFSKPVKSSQLVQRIKELVLP